MSVLTLQSIQKVLSYSSTEWGEGGNKVKEELAAFIK